MATEISNLCKDVAKLGPIGNEDSWEEVGAQKGRYKGGKNESQDKGRAVIRYANAEIAAVWVYLLGSPALDHCSLNLYSRRSLLL